MGTPIVPKMTYNLIENGQLNRSAAAEALRKFLEETIRAGKFDLKASVRTLDSSAREANIKALTELIRKAQSQGLIAAGDPAVLVAGFFSALAGDLLIRLLMRVREAPTEREIVTRARAAAETVMADR